MRHLRVGLGIGTLVASCAIAACSEAAPSTTTPSTIPATPTTSTSQPSSTTTTAPATTTSADTITALVTTLPNGTCDLGRPLPEGEFTVAVAGRLYGVSADAGSVRCLLDDAPLELSWSPVATSFLSGNRVITPSGEIPLDAAASYEWTQPTGQKVVLVTPGSVTKRTLDDGSIEDITFLDVTDEVAYHPAGTHLLAIGSHPDGRYGLWFATNAGADETLFAADEGAVLASAAWTGSGEPVFVARHDDAHSHIHRVEISESGTLEGPSIVDSENHLDMVLPSAHDPLLIAYRESGAPGLGCVEGGHARVVGIDLPEPLVSMTSVPVGWVDGERLLVMSYPAGCAEPGRAWVFSAGFCPGSEYGAVPLIDDVTAAAVRIPSPPPPPVPEVGSIIDPAPA
ncbi:MAG: hypothetical protein OEX04_04745 [Acidimicrobiia bacterium]|nr:hypothetical protein [Acidimicrobiia bacterium]MDH4306765.1 hypothetical protein [Acidimicrobiia bacterium]